MISPKDAEWARETVRNWHNDYQPKIQAAISQWRAWKAFKHKPRSQPNTTTAIKRARMPQDGRIRRGVIEDSG